MNIFVFAYRFVPRLDPGRVGDETIPLDAIKI